MTWSPEVVPYKTLEIATVLIAACGTLTNALSLSYFITRDNRGLSNRLIMLLNSFDLAVCVTACAVTMFYLYGLVYNMDDVKDVHIRSYKTLNEMYKVALEGTAFATCLLSVTRAVSLYRPFYQINGRGVVSAVVLFTSYVVVKHTTAVVWMYDYNIHLGLLLFGMILIIVVVAISNTATIVKLLRRRREEDVRLTDNNKQVTVTVIILSVLFCTLNLAYVGCLGVIFYARTTGTGYGPGVPEFLMFGAYFLVVPLNSAVNPAVYFIRKQRMRDYVKELWDTKVCCKRRRIENGRVEYTVVEEAMLEDTNM